jgi:hypothetical protein
MHAAQSSFHAVHLLGFFFFCPSIGTASTEQSYVIPIGLYLRLSPKLYEVGQHCLNKFPKGSLTQIIIQDS